MWTVGPEVTFSWSRFSYIASFNVQEELESKSATYSII